MTTTKYTPAELERAIENVTKAVHSDDLGPHVWARCAKVLCTALEAAQAEIDKLHRFMDVMDHDMLTDHYPYFECPHNNVVENLCQDCGAIILEKR